MRSSIFDSKPAALVCAKILIGICGVFIICFEILSNYLLLHDSATYRRVSQQFPEAIQARPSGPGEPTSVLMVGNSLLLYGIDMDRLRKLTSGSLRIHPLFLEATGYFDWQYGLRRLFRQGAKPQVVVVGLPVNSFFASGVRQDYSPKMLLDGRDVFDVASDLRLDRTATSNLLLAHASTFWDTRGVLRAHILESIVPHFQYLFWLVRTNSVVPQGPEFEAVAISRLRALREICEANGAKLILLIPPTPSSEDADRRMVFASQQVGVETIVPVDPTTLSARFYQPDATHLNTDGAAIFTSALATALLSKAVVLNTAGSPN